MTDERPRQRPELSARVLGEEVIILDRAVNQVHQLNASAGFIWQRCDGQHTPGGLADAVVAAFEIDAETARGAVLTALRRFRQLGLLSPDGH
jgi:hypothetical protein